MSEILGMNKFLELSNSRNRLLHNNNFGNHLQSSHHIVYKPKLCKIIYFGLQNVLK